GRRHYSMAGAGLPADLDSHAMADLAPKCRQPAASVAQGSVADSPGSRHRQRPANLLIKKAIGSNGISFIPLERALPAQRLVLPDSCQPGRRGLVPDGVIWPDPIR